MNFLEKHKNKICLGFWAVYMVIALSLLFYNVYLDCRQEYNLSLNSNIVANTSSDDFPVDKDTPLGKNLLDIYSVKFNSSVSDGRLKANRIEDKLILNGLKYGATFSLLIYDINLYLENDCILSLYYFSGNTTSDRIGFRSNYSDDTTSSSIEAPLIDKLSIQLKQGKTLSSIYLILPIDNTTFKDYTISFQIEKGNQATEYEQFYSLNSMYNQGHEDGYDKGYNKGLLEGEFNATDITMGNIVSDTIGSIAKFCKDLLSIEVWGISLFELIGSIGAVLVVVALLKVFIK